MLEAFRKTYKNVLGVKNKEIVLKKSPFPSVSLKGLPPPERHSWKACALLQDALGICPAFVRVHTLPAVLSCSKG